MLEKWMKFGENSCWRTGAYCIMHDKDCDVLIEHVVMDSIMLLEKGTKRSRHPNTAVTIVWNTLIEKSHIFECYRLHNKI